MRLEGSAALVTGGASGLGRATALALRDRGVEVVVLDLPQAADAIDGDRLTFAAADVRDEAAVASAVDVAAGEDRCGWWSTAPGSDRAAVSCARASRSRSISSLATIEVNLIGTFNVIRLAAAAIAADRAGRRRARRDRQHGLDRSLRRADRPGRLLGLQGRDRRHDAAARAGSGEFADPRA